MPFWTCDCSLPCTPWMRWARGAFHACFHRLMQRGIVRTGVGTWQALGQTRQIELLGWSPRVVVGAMGLQLACHTLQRPMQTVDALGAWRIFHPRSIVSCRKVCSAYRGGYT